MTKTQRAEFDAAWRKALSEGRVVRYNEGMSFKSFPTIEQAKAFLSACLHPAIGPTDQSATILLYRGPNYVG